MNRQTQKNITSSKYDRYRTPPEFKEVLDGLSRVGLDPCGHRHSVMNARKQYLLSRGENGLKLTWHGFGLVFVNNPYGRDKKRKNEPRTLRWLRKALRELRKHPDLEIVFLIASRTDSEAFQDYVFAKAQAVCFWRGRMRFLGPTKSGKRVGAMFPSAVVYFGPRPKAFRRAFKGSGKVMLLNVGAEVVSLAKWRTEKKTKLGVKKAA